MSLSLSISRLFSSVRVRFQIRFSLFKSLLCYQCFTLISKCYFLYFATYSIFYVAIMSLFFSFYIFGTRSFIYIYAIIMYYGMFLLHCYCLFCLLKISPFWISSFSSAHLIFLLFFFFLLLLYYLNPSSSLYIILHLYWFKFLFFFVNDI